MSDTVIVIQEDELTTIITEVDTEPELIESIDVGPPGPPGPEASEYKANFAWGDATPAILAVMEAGETLYAINLVILEPFDGAGAALSIGITGTPELFMAANECDPKTAGIYSVAPGYRFATEETIRLFITPGAGATKGHGVVMIDF